MISEASNPESVIAGESYNASIHVINNGNVPESVWLEIKSAPSYSFSVSPAKSVIEPRKSQEFLIHVKTDEKLNNKLNHILKIEAKSDSTGDREIRAVKSINVSVIPKITGNPDLYHRLPVRLSAILVGEKGKSALQSELAGAGNLDESGTRWVDFLFRGPATQNAGLYGQWEQYRFSYGNGLMDLHIGDRNYSLSRLTEQYRYGRGGEAKVHLNRMTTGFYYFETRWDNPEVDELAAYVRYQVNKELLLNANFLKKKEGETTISPQREDEIATVEMNLRHGEKIDFNLELGIDQPVNSHEDRDRGNAYRVNVIGNVNEKTRYLVERIYASPEFSGYYKDFDSVSASAAFPVYRKLQGNISYNSIEHSFEITDGILNAVNLNPSVINSPLWNYCNSILNVNDPICYERKKIQYDDETIKARLWYPFPSGTIVSLEYENFGREIMGSSTPMDFRERAVTLEVDQVIRNLNMHFKGEVWNLEDKANEIKRDGLSRYSFYFNYMLNDKLNYGFNIQTGNERFSGTDRRADGAGVYGQWRIKPQLKINMNYQWYEVHDRGSRDILSSWLSWTLPNTHSVDARLLKTNITGYGANDTSFLLAYNIPFGVPVSRKKSVGVIQGKIYDAESEQKDPISRVVLNVSGIYAVSNEHGEYIFPSLKPGTYYLWIEKGSLGLSKIAAQKMPVKIEVAEGATTELDIGVVTPGSISGIVKTSQNRELKDIFVEIKCGKLVLRQETDECGKFSFEDLPPGKWIVKISNYKLPEFHRLEKDMFEIDLKPGERSEITAVAVLNQKKMKLIETGSIVEQKQLNRQRSRSPQIAAE
jgi:hypothetical protein